jgi:hypothetical protein
VVKKLLAQRKRWKEKFPYRLCVLILTMVRLRLIQPLVSLASKCGFTEAIFSPLSVVNRASPWLKLLRSKLLRHAKNVVIAVVIVVHAATANRVVREGHVSPANRVVKADHVSLAPSSLVKVHNVSLASLASSLRHLRAAKILPLRWK